jgi:glycosyltransferase involved in cell wall biosynthesis
MDQSDIKKVSVVMCTYNGEKYLKEQIDSILDQTYPIYEIIIQDDCSTDNTWNILEDYALKNSVFRLFKNEKNLSWNLNFFDACLKVKGDYFAFSDQDDIWLKNKIEILISIIGDRYLAMGQDIVTNNGNRVLLNHIQQKELEQFLIKSSYPGHTMLLNSNILKIARDITYTELAHDNLFSLIALYYNNSVIITDKALQIWRIHGHNATALSNSSQDGIKLIEGVRKERNYLKSFAFLIRKIKSDAITKGFNKYYHLFKYLDNYSNSFHPSSKKLVEFTKLMRDQTFFGYLKASYICFQLRKRFFDYNKYSVQTYYSVITFVFKYWYERKTDM